MPDTAETPVLGLSNKAQEDKAPVEEIERSNGAAPSVPTISLLTDSLPLEDQLSRYTLWPEHEKRYGHSYKISIVAGSHDRTLIATTYKASSVDHAVIRPYDTSDWHEIKLSLTAHSLIITDLSFSDDDKFLLSVGRDRQQAVFARSEQDPATFTSWSTNPKGHSRRILGTAQAPKTRERIFAIAGRDESVKIWQKTGNAFTCKTTIALTSALSAVTFLPSPSQKNFNLAAGEDSGAVSIHRIATDTLKAQHIVTTDPLIAPSKTITQLSWRPVPAADVDSRTHFEFAVASEDTSARIYAISNILS